MPQIDWLSSEIYSCFQASCKNDVDNLYLHLSTIYYGLVHRQADLTLLRLNMIRDDIAMLISALCTEWCSLADSDVRECVKKVSEQLYRIVYSHHLFKCWR